MPKKRKPRSRVEWAWASTHHKTGRIYRFILGDLDICRSRGELGKCVTYHIPRRVKIVVTL